MHRRAVRLLVVAALIVTAVAAATASWDIERRLRADEQAEHDVNARIDRMTAAVAAVAAAGPHRNTIHASITEPPATVSDLVRHLDPELASLGDHVRSTEARATLQALTRSLTSLVEADARAREEANDISALDAAIADRSRHLATIAELLQSIRSADSSARLAQQRQFRRNGWLIVGGVGVLWLCGLAGLVKAPKGSSRVPAPATPSPDTAAAGAVAPQPLPDRDAVDWMTAAAVCTDLSRISATTALPDALARAAQLLDARGLIVWMGAGDELFVAASHGYDTRIANRLGPIRRTSTNATAAAWRTGRLTIVSSNGGPHGGIVAPMFNPTDCIGVLALEVPAGREEDRVVRAAAAIVAAQLATIVAAWPASSGAGRAAG